MAIVRSIISCGSLLFLLFIKLLSSGAAFVVSIVGMKLFRSAYSELSRQHVVLILSLLFFNVDYAHLNEGFPFNYFITAILFSKVREYTYTVLYILIIMHIILYYFCHMLCVL